MKKFVHSTDPIVKSAMDDEELVAQASICEEKDISSLIAGESDGTNRITQDDEAEDKVQREPPECCGGGCCD